MLKFKVVLTSLSIATVVSTVACSPEQKAGSKNPDAVTAPVTTAPIAAQSDAKRASDDFIAAQESIYNRSFAGKLKSSIETLSLGDIKDFKTRVEAAVTSETIGYNSAAKSLGHVVETHELQCYSGTSLWVAAAAQKATPEEFAKSNIVVINTAIDGQSHVLPGYIVADGENFILYGIEMTASGTAIQNFGRTDQIRIPMKVVEAIDWLTIEANRDGKNAASLAADAVAKAQHKFRFQPSSASFDRIKKSESKADVTGSPLSIGEEPQEKKQPRLAVGAKVFYGIAKPESAKAEIPKQGISTAIAIVENGACSKIIPLLTQAGFGSATIARMDQQDDSTAPMPGHKMITFHDAKPGAIQMTYMAESPGKLVRVDESFDASDFDQTCVLTPVDALHAGPDENNFSLAFDVSENSPTSNIVYGMIHFRNDDSNRFKYLLNKFDLKNSEKP